MKKNGEMRKYLIYGRILLDTFVSEHNRCSRFPTKRVNPIDLKIDPNPDAMEYKL